MLRCMRGREELRCALSGRLRAVLRAFPRGKPVLARSYVIVLLMPLSRAILPWQIFVIAAYIEFPPAPAQGRERCKRQFPP